MPYRRLSVFISGASLLTLGGCGAVPTQWMPNGYRYQDPTPISSPAPTRPWLDEAEHASLEKVGDSTAAWQGAIYELINPLPSILPPENHRITLRGEAPIYSSETAMDHYLRQGLMSYGYIVNPSPENNGTIIVYNASSLNNAATMKAAQAKLGKDFIDPARAHGMYYLTIDVLGPKGEVVSSQATTALLPYEKSEYMRWPGFTSQPVQGRGFKRPVYETRE